MYVKLLKEKQMKKGLKIAAIVVGVIIKIGRAHV